MGGKYYNELSRNLLGSWNGLARLRIGKSGLRFPFIAERFSSNEYLLTSEGRPCYTELVFPLSSE